MDLWTLLFSLSLTAAGILLILIVRSGFSREAESEPSNPSAYQEALKAQRKMERRRGRVWWKMEVLHAEFMKDTSVGGASGQPTPSEANSPAEECGVRVNAGNGITLKDVQGAYEIFSERFGRKS